MNSEETEYDQLLLSAGTNHKTRPSSYKSSRIGLLISIVVLLCVALAAVAVTVPCVYVFILSPKQTESQVEPTCDSNCNLSIVESIPENFTYTGNHASHLSTYLAWMRLLQAAKTNVTISSSYWTLRGSRNINDKTDKQGSDIFSELNKTSLRGVKIRVVQTPPSFSLPNNDSKVLAHMGVIELRNLNVTKFLGSGILHTKMWIVDDQHFYIGSANMDWRSLTQVKELGILGTNCSCLGKDVQKIFEVYWSLAADGRKNISSDWPESLTGWFNLERPAQLKVNGTPAEVFFGSSPPEFCTKKRTDDLSALLNVINKAKTFVYIAVMDYLPAMVFTKQHVYWSLIDDALRTAAYNRGVRVKLMGSYWNHTSREMKGFLQSLGSLNGVGQLNGSIETKLFVVPPVKNKDIPFTRVNHNKYMVTNNAAYIGTSNWSGDYFVYTGGVSCIVNQTNSSSSTTVQTVQ